MVCLKDINAAPTPERGGMAAPAVGGMPSSGLRSQVRGLIRDAADCLTQEMYFLGCDVVHPSGNLLLRYGMTRIPRAVQHGEGSSRYRMPWMGGTIELHSFCVGWYPEDGTANGVVFVRGREAFFNCSGAEPITPGLYEKERIQSIGRDEMLHRCTPLLSWVAAYERWVPMFAPEGYRAYCWNKLASLRLGKPWLPPDDVQEWILNFIKSPETTLRAKKLLRERRGAS